MQTKITLDRIEEGQAVLATDTKETIYIPVRLLPASAKEGNVYYIDISENKAETRDSKEQAKNILNEILKG